MLFITFQIGEDRYALEGRHVVEVLPLVNVKAIPQTSHGVAGVFNFHGQAVPVVDLTALAYGQPSKTKMNTRIIVVRYPAGQGADRVLGLRAEHVTDTLRKSDEDFSDSGVVPKEARYLGPVTMERGRIIQRVDIAQLLPEEVIAQLLLQCQDCN